MEDAKLLIGGRDTPRPRILRLSIASTPVHGRLADDRARHQVTLKADRRPASPDDTPALSVLKRSRSGGGTFVPVCETAHTPPAAVVSESLA